MLPDEIFINIFSFIKYKYAFSVTCKKFNELFRKLVVPSPEEVARAFIKCMPDRTLLHLIENPHCKLDFGRNMPLAYACFYGREQIVARLLKDERVNPVDDDNKALNVAIAVKHLNIIKMFLDDPRIVVTPGLLHNVINTKHPDIIKLFLKREEVDPNSVILQTLRMDDDEIFELIINDPRVDQKKVLFLIEAIENGDLKLL